MENFSTWQQPQFAWKLCIGIYICVSVMCIPNMFVHEISIYEGAVWEPEPQCVSFFPPNYTEPMFTFTVRSAWF